MRTRWRNVGLVLASALLISVALIGCSSKDDNFGGKPKKGGDGGTETKDETKGTQTATLAPIKGKGVATLKGTVKLVGEEPDYAALTKKLEADFHTKPDDENVCLMGSPTEKSEYSWVVDKGTKGVNNVFIWLRPDNDKTEFFDVKAQVDQVKGFEKVVKIDQPHCAFVPHALVLFQRYVDPAKPSRSWRVLPANGGPPATGQDLFVVNTGKLNHNTSSEDAANNTSRLKGINTAVAPDGKLKVDDIQPSYGSPVKFKCSVHSWMQSWIWSFEHPFACVTGSKVGGKELKPGEFVIESIPAGVKLRVVAWHEEGKFLNGGEKGEEITLKEGDNSKDFTIRYTK